MGVDCCTVLFLSLHVWLPGSSWCVWGHRGEMWCWWLLSGHCTTDWHNPPYDTGALEASLLWQSTPWPAVGNGGVEKQLGNASEAESSFLLSPFTYSWVTVQYICVRDKQGERARAWDISDRQGLPNLRGKSSNELVQVMPHSDRDCPVEGKVVPAAPSLQHIEFPSLQHKGDRSSSCGLWLLASSATFAHRY